MSDKEREELHAWIEARESHRRLFQELCSLEAVKEDVRAREAVDSKTAVEAMRRRIQESEALEEDVRPTVGSKFRSLRVWVSAAVITLFVSLVGLGGWEYYSHVSKWEG